MRLDGGYGYAEVCVNDKRAKKSYFKNTVNVTDLVKKGKNQLVATFYTGNRNLLGPHHNVSEECGWVDPETYKLVVGCESDGPYIFGESVIKVNQ